MSTTALVFLILGIIFAVMVVVVAVVGVFVVMPAIKTAQTASRTTMARNNLKQIGLAHHNYHDVFGMLPPITIKTVEGEPYHGWMTYLLPYMEQAPIYNEIDFHEPWTAPVNQPAFGYMVPPYVNQIHLNKDPASSHVNGLGAAHFAANSQMAADNSGLRFRDIIDGTSNTILAGEVATGFKPWGDPENKRDPAAGLAATATQFGPSNPESRVVMFLMVDGSVRMINTGISQETLGNLANPKDGNPIGEF